jgi:uncharacterized protein YdeI (YjbR/CyaY-like superfamily)
LPGARRPTIQPTTFRSPAEFRRWLDAHHDKATELYVRCYRVSAADKGLTYKQALDEALCFGWIDGVRPGGDGESFWIRFSPRTPRSIWSLVNIRHAERLIAEGRMTPAGRAAFDARDPARSGVYSFERRDARFTPVLERAFRKNRAAWTDFEQRPPWYRRTTTHWVMSAKREETRERRLATLIDCCARGRPIPGLERSQSRAREVP